MPARCPIPPARRTPASGWPSWAAAPAASRQPTTSGSWDNSVTVYEQQKKLGRHAPLRHPQLPLPPGKSSDEEIASILSTGIEVKLETTIGKDISYNDLRKQYDALYLAIGAQTDKKTGIPGEDSQGVISAVEMLRGIGDDIMPDFTGKKVVVIAAATWPWT